MRDSADQEKKVNEPKNSLPLALFQVLQVSAILLQLKPNF